jgi:hypothetical protein
MVGRRGEVEQHPGGEAEQCGELRPAVDRGDDHQDQCQVGDDTLDRDVPEDHDLRDDGGGHECG